MQSTRRSCHVSDASHLCVLRASVVSGFLIIFHHGDTEDTEYRLDTNMALTRRTEVSEARVTVYLKRFGCLSDGRDQPSSIEMLNRRATFQLVERQLQTRFASRWGSSIHQSKRAAVSLGDLTRQNQANPGPFSFSRKEWDEKIGSVCQSRPLIADPQINLAITPIPANLHPTAGFQRSINGVADQINQ